MAGRRAVAKKVVEDSRRNAPRASKRSPRPKSPAEEFQDAHALVGKKDNSLEVAIGHQVRAFRNKLDITVVELAKLAGLSAGMLSKIENGNTSPSLGTLQALARALHVPVTAFFRSYEEQRDATFVRAGEGLQIERRGTRAGHQYKLLGHSVGKRIAVEPYMITLTEESEVFPVFQHSGMEFLYMLEGRVRYRHGDKTYDLSPGDSLFFDSEAPHGPEEIAQVPARFLSIIVYPRYADE
ncbi:MAG: XRE family transcriptional regulator [Deferrisomatales bacterium]